jgi:phage terminase large subunit GpA-like protein
VWNFEELRQVQKDLRVADDDVAIDSGYNASIVYGEVVKSDYQWKAFKGDRAAYFSHGGMRRCWTFSQADPAIGTSQQGKVKPVRLFIWSNQLTKDTLAMHMRGLAAPWEIPDGATQEYLDQITAESREQMVSAKGVVSYEWVKLRNDNHAFDLECMNLVCAMVTKITEMPSMPDEVLTPLQVSDTEQ